MRKTVTSREEILDHCQSIVLEQGLTAIDIRTVASACHVSVGSIYNHFASKDDLVFAVLTDAWTDIFNIEDDLDQTDNFTEFIKQIYHALAKKREDKAGFFNYYSIGLAYKDQEAGRALFANACESLRESMVAVYKKDKQVPPMEDEILDDYMRLIISMILTVLMHGLMDKTSLELILERVRIPVR